MGEGNAVVRNGTSTITSKKVKLSVFVQCYPDESSSGIAGVAYTVTKGKDLGGGKTDADGRVKVETDDTGAAEFTMFGTTFDARALAEIDAATPTEPALALWTAQARLYALGYDIGGVAELAPDAELDDALLQFEAVHLDRVGTLQGLVTRAPATRGAAPGHEVGFSSHEVQAASVAALQDKGR